MHMEIERILIVHSIENDKFIWRFRKMLCQWWMHFYAHTENCITGALQFTFSYFCEKTINDKTKEIHIKSIGFQMKENYERRLSCVDKYYFFVVVQ